MRKLVAAYYSNDFSFGRFMREHPEHQGNLTDLLDRPHLLRRRRAHLRRHGSSYRQFGHGKHGARDKIGGPRPMRDGLHASLPGRGRSGSPGSGGHRPPAIFNGPSGPQTEHVEMHVQGGSEPTRHCGANALPTPRLTNARRAFSVPTRPGGTHDMSRGPVAPGITAPSNTRPGGTHDMSRGPVAPGITALSNSRPGGTHDLSRGPVAPGITAPSNTRPGGTHVPDRRVPHCNACMIVRVQLPNHGRLPSRNIFPRLAIRYRCWLRLP